MSYFLQCIISKTENSRGLKLQHANEKQAQNHGNISNLPWAPSRGKVGLSLVPDTLQVSGFLLHYP